MSPRAGLRQPWPRWRRDGVPRGPPFREARGYLCAVAGQVLQEVIGIVLPDEWRALSEQEIVAGADTLPAPVALGHLQIQLKQSPPNHSLPLRLQSESKDTHSLLHQLHRKVLGVCALPGLQAPVVQEIFLRGGKSPSSRKEGQAQNLRMGVVSLF